MNGKEKPNNTALRIRDFAKDGKVLSIESFMEKYAEDFLLVAGRSLEFSDPPV